MQVRRLGSDEWERFRSVRLRALADAPDAFGATYDEEAALTKADWRRRLESPDRAVFVVDEGFGSDGRGTPDEAVALATGGPAPDFPNVAALYGMWVAPEARGQGHGEALVDAVKTWAVEAGYPALGLGVTTTNAPAIALYQRVGFLDSGDRYPLREGTGLTIQIMVMPLT